MQNPKRLATVYLVTDFMASALAWMAFYAYRKTEIEGIALQADTNLYLGLAVIPLGWIVLYTLNGSYLNVYRKNRLGILARTLWISIFGCALIFFVLLLDDNVIDHTQYYTLFAVLLGFHAGLTLTSRLIISSVVISRIRSGKVGFNTLIVGGQREAVRIYKELESLHHLGYNVVGYVNLNGTDRLLDKHLPFLGHFDTVHEVIEQHRIHDAVVALETVEHDRLNKVITALSGYDISIRLIPDMYDIVSGSVKTTNIYGALLAEVESGMLPIWQRVIKRAMDITLSIFAMLLLLPVYIVLSILVRTDSKGPIFFTQERIGRHGQPFRIIKFRTMVQDAEKSGPQLSSSSDPRITGIGKFMRKTRLDEIPQFWNVIKGDMSLVGPRPERAFYIDQILQMEPHFRHLNKVRPGITSWGQVKYGYAENVEQMLQRMKYDLLYIKNMSLALDIKILLYTVITVLKGTGK